MPDRKAKFVLRVLLSFLACALPVAAQHDVALPLGTSIEKEIAGREVHTWRTALAAHQFARVIVAPVGFEGVDTFVRVIAPDGKPFLEVRNLGDTARPKRVLWVAETTGEYKLEVVGNGEANLRGRYEIQADEPRLADDAARQHIAAARAFAAADQLHMQRSAEALRQARTKYEEALALYRTLDDKQGEMWTLLAMPQILFVFGEPQKALELEQQVLTLARALNHPYGQTVALQAVALIAQSLGDWQQAQECLQQALPLQRAAGNKFGAAGTLNNLGGLHMQMGEWQKALDYYGQALPLQQAQGHQPGVAVALNNLGETHRLLGDYEQARDYFQRSLELRRSLKDARGEGTTLSNIGLTYLSEGNLPRALEYYQLALPLRRTTGDAAGEASTLNNLGAAYFKAGELQKALEHFTPALELNRKIKNVRGEANSLHLLGKIQMALGETEQAVKQFQQALSLHRAIRDQNTEAATLYQLARAEIAQGKLTAARANLEAALALTEAARAQLISQDLRASYLAAKRDYYELYTDLLMQLHKHEPQAQHDAAALEVSERGRARNLLEILHEARADLRQGVDAELLERERSLQRRINAQEQQRLRLQGNKAAEKQLATIETQLTQLLHEYEILQTQIRAASPRYAALTQPQPLGLAEMQRQLDDETLLLEYALGAERSYVWAITRDSLTSYELPKRAEIEAAARLAYQLLTARNQISKGETTVQRQVRIAQADADWPRAAAALSALLLQPIAAQLHKPRLVIVADGALQYVPFAALPECGLQNADCGLKTTSNPRDAQTKASRQQRTGQSAIRNPQSAIPLIANHELITLPSASVLAVLRQERATRAAAPKTLAVMADPVFELEDPRLAHVQKPLRAEMLAQREAKPLLRAAADTEVQRFMRLRFTRTEAEAIAAFAPAAQKLTALDFAASRATLTRQDLSQFRILHFATHGVLNSRHPELSGLVLSLVDEAGNAQDGFFRLHEVYNLKLNAELVVLSGCRTALGREIKGEGLIGLTRGFMYAGAARVMASLWSIDDRATADLMKRLYEAMLGQKQPPAAALRAAQIEMAKTKAPYFWAAFTIQGEWR
jgi:CHAT domain-containing protein/tetratricopeptide (TPR) repeat protein